MGTIRREFGLDMLMPMAMLKLLPRLWLRLKVMPQLMLMLRRRQDQTRGYSRGLRRRILVGVFLAGTIRLGFRR